METTEHSKLSEEQKKVLEKFGVLLETKGWQPAVARVFALLMISTSGELTFDEIRETLQLSKSATSTSLNTLLNLERIEYITRTGDRKRYFRSKIISLRDMVKQEHKARCDFADVLKEVLEVRSNHPNEANQNLEDAIGYLNVVNEEFPKLYEKWERNKNR